MLITLLMDKNFIQLMGSRIWSYKYEVFLLANEMNQCHFLGKKLKNEFLINTIRKKKRFAKWIKPISSDDLEVVKEYYGYSNEKARQVLPLLSDDQMGQLRQRIFKGGK